MYVVISIAIHNKYINGNLLISNTTEIFVNAIAKVIKTTVNVDINNCLEDLLSINGIFFVLIK